MSKRAAELRERVIARAVDGDGFSKREDRRAAFEDAGVPEDVRTLVEKVAKNAWKVTDEDIEKVKKAGLSDDEIFELVVCATLGQAKRQLDAALSAVAKAKAKT